jgi:hypothetical protein
MMPPRQRRVCHPQHQAEPAAGGEHLGTPLEVHTVNEEIPSVIEPDS